MTFFVPGDRHSEEEWRAMRAETERSMGRSYSDRRVRRIQFVHNGEIVTAEVGKQLHGHRHRHTQSRQRDYSRPDQEVTYDATVLAIFEGHPYVVWWQGTDRAWQHPWFIAGTPSEVESFEP